MTVPIPAQLCLQQPLLFLLALLFQIPLFVQGQSANRFRQGENRKAEISPGNTLMQDSYGFIWFGTITGLVKYDGYDLTTYAYDRLDTTSLTANGVAWLFEDSQKRLWVGLLDAGLCLFQRDEGNFIRIKAGDDDNGLRSHRITGIVEDEAGNIWVGGRDLQRVIKIDVENRVFEFETFHPQKELVTAFPGGRVNHLYKDARNDIWIASNRGVSRYNPDTGDFTSSKTDTTFPAGNVRYITGDQNGNVWLALLSGPLIQYEWKTGQFIRHPEVTIQASQSYLLVSPDNTLYATVPGKGLYQYDIGTRNAIFHNPGETTLNNLRGLYGRVMVCDHVGNLWMAGGTPMQYLPATHKQVDHYVFPYEGYNSVSAVYANDREIWIGNLIGGLLQYDKSNGTYRRYLHDQKNAHSLADNRIYRITPLRNGKMLICARKAVHILDPNSHSFQRILTAKALYRWGHEDPAGNIWIATEGTGLHRLAKDSWKVTRHLDGENDKMAVRNVRMIHEDPDGTFWLASSYDGLIHFNPLTGAITQYASQEGEPESIIGNRVECLYKESDQYIWAGTRSGLSRLNIETGTAISFTKKDGLSHDNISSITQDDAGNIWVATDNGINKIDARTNIITQYDTDDGFLNAEYYYRAAFRDEHGMLYFGGTNGLEVFDPENIKRNPVPPKLQLTGFQVFNKDYPLPLAFENISDITLNYDQSVFSLKYAGMHYVAQKRIKYHYLMEGLHDEWVDAGTDREATFTGLRPGHYTFHLKASNGEGIWTESPVSINLYIRPPWWRTWWFYSLCAVGLLVLGASAYRYRINQIKKEQKRQTAFNKKIAEIEMKALRAQMNPHFLFNSLNSVKSLIAQNDNDRAMSYLIRFGQLIRQILNNSRKKFVRLNDELQALRLYLDLEAMRFGDKFTYEIEVDQNVNTDFIDVPPLILQPYVENAIWHGLMHKESADRNLHVKISRNGENITMVVEDNGIGRIQAKELHTRSGSKQESLGMKITGDRLKFLQEVYGKRASVRIDDLADPTGTRVTITLPIPD